MFLWIFGHSKGAYFWLPQADLNWKLSPLDSPFWVLLDSAISFHSKTHPKIKKYQGYSLGVFVNFGHSKGGYFRFLRVDLNGKLSQLDSPFQVLLDSAISFYSETHSEIDKTKAIALVLLSIFGHSKGAYFWILQADLNWKLSPLDSPFQILLNSAI